MKKMNYRVKIGEMYVASVSTYYEKVHLSAKESDAELLDLEEKNYLVKKFPNAKVQTIQTLMTEYEGG